MQNSLLDSPNDRSMKNLEPNFAGNLSTEGQKVEGSPRLSMTKNSNLTMQEETPASPIASQQANKLTASSP